MTRRSPSGVDQAAALRRAGRLTPGERPFACKCRVTTRKGDASRQALPSPIGQLSDLLGTKRNRRRYECEQLANLGQQGVIAATHGEMTCLVESAMHTP